MRLQSVVSLYCTQVALSVQTRFTTGSVTDDQDLQPQLFREDVRQVISSIVHYFVDILLHSAVSYPDLSVGFPGVDEGGEVLVHHVDTQTSPHSLHLGEEVTDHLDVRYLGIMINTMEVGRMIAIFGYIRVLE